MTVRDVVAIAAHGLETHRLRTTLSSIGIVFGVATVVAALAVGEGARRDAVAQFSSLGIDNVIARSAAPGASDHKNAPAAPALGAGDVEALRAGIPTAASIAAIRDHRSELAAGTVRKTAFLVGTHVDYSTVAGIRVGSGRWLVADDLRSRRRVMVIGHSLSREMFASRSALGQHVFAAGEWFVVVGVLAPRGVRAQTVAAAQRFDADDAAFVPLPSMDVSLGRGDALDRVEEIIVRAASAGDVQHTASATSAILGRRHPRQSTYEIVVPRELLEARLRALRTFNIVLVSVGALALLISGIGIMNIMLASVAERTAEIGVRRAFGATRREIVAQFTAEASLLCGCGGAAGAAVGFVLAQSISALAAWPVAVSASGVAVALLMSIAVGLTFGVYPAYLAGNLEPADALRAP